MPTYIWLGITHEGRKISGKEYAQNHSELKSKLVKQNIFLIKIKYDYTHILKICSKIKTKDITHLIEQISVLVNANTPIIKALSIISQDEKNHKIKELIIDCKNSISEGKSLHQTWQQYPQYFTPIICSLINVGEQSGTLDIMLCELTNYLKKNELEKRKIIKALLYPVTILSITIIVILILFIFVIPQFETMFSNFGAKLPGYTQFIINLNHFLQDQWWLILGSIISILIAIKITYKRSIKFRHSLGIWLLKLPIIKKILTYSIIVRLTKTLSLTLKSGIPLITAINITTPTLLHWQYRLAMQNIKKLIANGKAFHNALQEQNLFPTKVTQLIALGEETGTLESILSKISNIYNEELNNLTDNLNTLLEPIIMLILGLLVGGLVIGMYLPIFRLGTII